jgi:GT2 family glycosyltransferase/glycosyltransferase involved in cell wall biosynthesis
MRLAKRLLGYSVVGNCWRVLRTRSLAPLRNWRAVRAIARSGLFDGEWYLENNPDVAACGTDPIWHYVAFGEREGRNPSWSFSTWDYLLHNPDVAAAGVNPLLHFVLYGAAEGRKGGTVGPKTRRCAELVPSGRANGFGNASFLSSVSIPAAAIPNALANAQRWCTNAKPQVSILIINWNAAELTLECVRHIWANTDDATYEIIIADNGSDWQDIAPLKKLGGGTRLLELGTNRFFGEANNIAAEQATGKYICFLSNDAFVRSGWLRSLVEELVKAPEAGAVGPMFLFPDNTLQEAGGAIDAKGYPTRFGRHLDPATPEFNVPKFVDCISAATLLMEKQLFLKAGGFELAYEPAYYEDTDLCFKLRAMGWKTRYCPAAKVIQIEGWSANDDLAKQERRKVLGDLNRDKFMGRWGAYLETRSEDDLLQSRKHIPRAQGQQADESALPIDRARSATGRVAVFTPFALSPGGGERYILTLASALANGKRVAIVTPQPYSHLRLQSLGREFDLDLSQCDVTTYDRFISAPRPEFMFTLGNRIVPSVAAHAGTSWYHCQFPFPLEATALGSSRNLLAGYRGIIVNSEFTKEHALRALKTYKLPSVPIEIIHPPVTMIGGDAGRKKNIILNVGRFFVGGHSKRQDLIIEVFRTLIEKYGGEIDLHLAGSSVPEPMHIVYLSELQKNARQLPVKFHVNPTTEALWALYRDAAIYWHATGLHSDIEHEPGKAEHFGISIVEAMSAECVPLAFNAGGPREIITHGVNGFLYDTADSLVDITVELLHGNGAARRIEMGRAAGVAAARYTIERFVADVRRLVDYSGEIPPPDS